MGFNDHTADLYEVAETAATKAGAVYRCPNHDHVLLTHGDQDADKNAYAIATNVAKGRGYGLEAMREAVAAVLQAADYECPYPPCNLED
jgi:hypothetical protein